MDREALEELRKLIDGCGKMPWCGLTNHNHMLCCDCDDIMYAALPKLIAEVERLSTPTHFFDADNWEYTTEDSSDVTDNLGGGDINEVGRLVRLPNKFVARVSIEIDADSDELRWFDTKEEAKVALQSGGSHAK